MCDCKWGRKTVSGLTIFIKLVMCFTLNEAFAGGMIMYGAVVALVIASLCYMIHKRDACCKSLSMGTGRALNKKERKRCGARWYYWFQNLVATVLIMAAIFTPECEWQDVWEDNCHNAAWIFETAFDGEDPAALQDGYTAGFILMCLLTIFTDMYVVKKKNLKYVFCCKAYTKPEEDSSSSSSSDDENEK